MSNPFSTPEKHRLRRAAGLAHDAVRGRGTPLNPGNRFIPVSLTLDGETLDDDLRDHPSGVQVRTRIFCDDTQSILSRNDSPDIPFSYSLNPYRGCEHGCIYCYARPGHEYLSMSSGLDFETQIMAKADAPALLRTALRKPSWQKPRGVALKGWSGATVRNDGESGIVEPITMSGVTDPYQPIERKLQITRKCLEVMLEFHQPLTIITKNALVTRDIDLLSQFAKWPGGSGVRVALSITSLDPHTAQVMEPRASAPRDRLRAVRELTDAGIDVAVMTAPIIPGINDHEIPALLQAAADAGATSAGYVLLRLPWQIKTLFLEWLVRHFPDRAAKVESLLRQTRSGELYDPTWGDRMKGTGPVAENIARTFEVFSKKAGLGRKPSRKLNTTLFRIPEDADGQLRIF